MHSKGLNKNRSQVEKRLLVTVTKQGPGGKEKPDFPSTTMVQKNRRPIFLPTVSLKGSRGGSPITLNFVPREMKKVSNGLTLQVAIR